MTAADGIAVDHGDDRLWQSAYLHLHIEHAQSWHAVLVNLSAAPFHVHIAS